MGTPGYSPSEQFTTHGKNGPWTDLYSLGATCYRLITGEVPQDAISRLEEDDQRPLARRAELKRRFSHEFLATIDKAMCVARRDRWQSAQEWLAALQPKPAETPVKSAPTNRQSAERKPAEESSETTSETDVDTMVTGMAFGSIIGVIYLTSLGISFWTWEDSAGSLLGLLVGAFCGLVGGALLGVACAWFGIKVSKIKGNFIGTLAAIFVYVLAAFVCWICFYC